MTSKWISLGLLLAIAGALAWTTLGADALHRLKSMVGAGTVEPDRTATRKCIDGDRVSYTNGRCPPGSREQPLDAGTLTVLPSGALPARPATASAPKIGNARDLLLEPARPGEQDQKERRIDAIVNR